MLPEFERQPLETLLSRLAEEPVRLINISGPRQCGKTTLVRQALQRDRRPHQYISADLPVPDVLPRWGQYDVAPTSSTLRHGLAPPDKRWIVHNWEQARTRARQSEKGFILVLDEVHHIPDWSRTVKGMWDKDRYVGLPLHVVLLGSAQLVYRTSMSEALTGRFETIRLAHWSYEEMKAAFDVTLDEYIYFGGYPGAAHLIKDDARWRDYVLDVLIEPTLERDVLAASRIDKPRLMRQLVELGSAYSAQIVSYNGLLGQLTGAGNATTIAHYLDLLSQVGLMTGLSKYSGSMLQRKRSTPKLQVLNNALMSALGSYSFDEAKSDRSHWGHLVESAVGAHLCNTATGRHKVHYWRSKDVEVDFVLQRGQNVLGIEVKATAHRRRASNLARFENRFEAAKTLIVGTGGMSLQEFLRTPSPELFNNL